MEALYIAERTKRLRIATGVLVLPHWPPLRLAEEVAVLDNLSDGRFTCGIGRGFQPYEFAGFGVAPEESRARFEESLDVLLKAWTSDEQFTYDGRYVKVPDPVAVWPKPMQKPHPPLWVAGSSDDTIRMAAERSIVPLTSSFLGIERIRAAAALWTRTRREIGLPIDGLDLGIQTMTHIADTDEEARANLLRSLAKPSQSGPQPQGRAGRPCQRRAVSRRGERERLLQHALLRQSRNGRREVPAARRERRHLRQLLDVRRRNGTRKDHEVDSSDGRADHP
jgi:Coenzyme F420-dependent N5,N10-methylene tetrahydromethanopterin reductase and related flavin-dependent oxidoreductases